MKRTITIDAKDMTAGTLTYESLRDEYVGYDNVAALFEALGFDVERLEVDAEGRLIYWSSRREIADVIANPSHLHRGRWPGVSVARWLGYC